MIKELNILNLKRNLAITKSKGKLISFLDVDDWWVNSKLRKQVDIFLKDKSVDIVYSNVYLYYERNNSKKIYIKKKLMEGKLTQHLINKFEMPILSTIIKKNIFNKIKFDNRYTIIGDFDFFVRLSLTHNISAHQEPLAYYRVHDSNLTTKKIGLHIKEIESWVLEKIKNKNFNSINFSKTYEEIEILKIKKNLIEGNRFRAFLGILRRPYKILKLKFFN